MYIYCAPQNRYSVRIAADGTRRCYDNAVGGQAPMAAYYDAEGDILFRASAADAILAEVEQEIAEVEQLSCHKPILVAGSVPECEAERFDAEFRHGRAPYYQLVALRSASTDRLLGGYLLAISADTIQPALAMIASGRTERSDYGRKYTFSGAIVFDGTTMYLQKGKKRASLERDLRQFTFADCQMVALTAEQYKAAEAISRLQIAAQDAAEIA